MTEDSGRAVDTQRVLDELSRSNSAASAKRKKQRQRITLVLLILTPLILGVAYTTYNQWRVQSSIADLRQETEQLSAAQQSVEAHLLNQISRMNNQLGDLTVEVTSSDAVDEELLARLQQDFLQQFTVMRDSVTGVQQQLGKVQSRDEQWLYTEVLHLLRVAQQKLELDTDIESSIGLLRNAHSLLEASGNPATATLRERVASDLEALEALTPPDIAGIYLQLAGLADVTSQLTLIGAQQEAYTEQLKQRWDEAADVARTDFATSTLDLLGSIFVWREWEDAPEEFLPPQQEYYMRENLQLLLAQAQLALLMREQPLFVETLAHSRVWLERYGLAATAQGREMIAQLDQLMLIELRPAVPDLTDTIGMARQLRTDPASSRPARVIPTEDPAVLPDPATVPVAAGSL